MRRQIIVSLVLSLGLLCGGVFTWAYLVRTQPKPPETDAARPVLKVRGARLEPQTVVEPIVGFGTARADRYAWVAAQVGGEVAALAEDLRVGSVVGAGAVLVRVDEREYRAALERARSSLAADEAALQQFEIEESNLTGLIGIAEQEFGVAERELQRVRDLLEGGSSNPREADRARLEFEQARRALQTLLNQRALLPQRRVQQWAVCDLRRADVAVAELNLERCTIAAPFAGRLDLVNVELGEQVGPGQRLLALVDPLHIEVPIELPVSLRGRVRVTAPCQLRLESRRDAFWTGRVARIAPSANEATRTFALFVEVDNAAQAEPLIPGMFVRAQMDGPTLEDVLILPRGSIQDERVFVLRDGCVYEHAVRVERFLLDQAIVSGLEPGAVVVTSNLDALYEGAAVEVLLDERRPAPAAAARAPRTAGPSPAQPPAQSPVKTP